MTNSMRDIRVSIAFIVTILICMGIVMIYSSSGIYALQQLNDNLYYLKRHVLFLAVGVALMLIIMAMDYRVLKKWSKPMVFISIIVLVLVLIPFIGKASYGARRWFKIGMFNIQPSEFVKIALIIYSADYLSRKQNKIRDFTKGFLPLLLVLGLNCVLILKQPDMGSSVSIAMIIFIMMFAAGARLTHMGILILSALPVLYLLIAKVPYRLKRIMTFLDPWQDSSGAGFQLSQSQIALGSGGIFGVGLGHSMQKLYYLPAAHTDFILSIIGEELGYLGVQIIVILFILLIWQGARIAKRTTDPFGYFLAIGLVAMIGLQAVINIGVSIGALPTKGLPLPFISYGGSALLADLMCIGLLLNISRIQDLHGQ